MTDTTDNSMAREQAMRHRLLGHVNLHLDDSVIHIAAEAFEELLADGHEEMCEELLLPIFKWSDFWPKRLATEILGLSTDEEYDWEELLEGFEARERRMSSEQPEKSHWKEEGF